MSNQVLKIIYITVVLLSWMVAYAFWARYNEVEWEENHMFENFEKLKGKQITIPSNAEMNQIVDFNFFLDDLVLALETSPNIYVFFEPGTHPSVKHAFAVKMNEIDGIEYADYTSEEEAFKEYYEYNLTGLNEEMTEVLEVLNDANKPVLPSSFDIYLTQEVVSSDVINELNALDQEVTDSFSLATEQIIITVGN